MKSTYCTLLLLTCMLWAGTARAQVQPAQQAPQAPPPEQDHSYKPLTLKLSEDGSKYLRFFLWHQFWVRSTENNPGTVGLAGGADSRSFDIGLRRSRVLAMAQVSPRFLILTHFGINNQNFVNGGAPGAGAKKPGLFMHDVWTEYMAVKDKLYIGAGLHYWNGISRLSNASTLNFMTLDAPIFNWPNIELTDQFARQFGIYAKGQLGGFDYRVALNKPFAAGGAAVEGQAVNRLNDELAVQGYFNFQFLDKESNKLPYMVGTYLGSKRILNIGAGFYYHPESTHSLQGGQTRIHDTRLLGLDVFWEQPTAMGGVFSLYSTLYSYDFGPNYIRNVGLLNVGQAPAQDSPIAEQLAFNGPGNAQPTIGTGSISYTQLGYGFPKFNNGTQLMPYVTYTRKDFERLNDESNQFDLGLNYFINGHHAKLTLQYSSRPVYQRVSNNLDGYKGEWILQTHIFL